VQVWRQEEAVASSHSRGGQIDSPKSVHCLVSDHASATMSGVEYPIDRTSKQAGLQFHPVTMGRSICEEGGVRGLTSDL
jgi:hypothetical protein